MANKVFNHFDQTQLYKMVRQEGLKGDESDSSKKLVETLTAYVEELGFNFVTEGLKKTQLEELAGPLKLETGEKTNNKSVIRKRLVQAAKDEGLADFFARKEMSSDLLKTFAQVAGADEDSKNVAKAIQQAVAETGMTVFFNRFEVEFLQDLMEACKLQFDTVNQNALANALATQSDAKKEKKKGGSSKPKFSKTKKPLEKGITKEDIFQHYYSDELVKFCKENDIKHSGAKKDLIKRIVAFLDGDTEAAKGSPKKRKRSSSASSKKKTTKKSTTKKEKEGDKEGEEKKPKSPKKAKKTEKTEKTEEKTEDAADTEEKEDKKNGKKSKTTTK